MIQKAKKGFHKAKHGAKRISKEIISIKFGKYFVTGLLAFAVDTAVLNILKFQVFDNSEGEKIFGVIYTAKLISSIFGIIVSFALNRYWSFQATHAKAHSQAWKMAIVFFINIFIAAAIYSFFYEILTVQDIMDFGNLTPTLANAMTTGTMMFTNFFIYKKVIFK